LVEARRRFWCPRLYPLLRREGFGVNHKRIESLFPKEALDAPATKTQRQSHLRVVQPAPIGPNE